jgi:hypothetical protein
VKCVDIGIPHPGWLIITDFQKPAAESIPDPVFVEEVKSVIVVPIEEEIPVAAAPPPQLPRNPTSTLHAWQEKAWKAWEEASYRGMLFAIECAKRLSKLHRPLNTLIVVPTIPLMHQWKRSIERFASEEFPRVGLLGDGHKDNFSKSPIVVAVVNSASERVYELLQHTLGADARVKSLLIADEVTDIRMQLSLGVSLNFLTASSWVCQPRLITLKTPG